MPEGIWRAKRSRLTEFRPAGRRRSGLYSAKDGYCNHACPGSGVEYASYRAARTVRFSRLPCRQRRLLRQQRPWGMPASVRVDTVPVGHRAELTAPDGESPSCKAPACKAPPWLTHVAHPTANRQAVLANSIAAQVAPPRPCFRYSSAMATCVLYRTDHHGNPADTAKIRGRAPSALFWFAFSSFPALQCLL